MDMLIELVVDLLFDAGLEVTKNKKISKWIRYPLIVLIVLFIIGVIGCLMCVGIVMILSKEKFQMLLGAFILLVAIVLLICTIKNIKKEKNKRISEVK